MHSRMDPDLSRIRGRRLILDRSMISKPFATVSMISKPFDKAVASSTCPAPSCEPHQREREHIVQELPAQPRWELVTKHRVRVTKKRVPDTSPCARSRSQRIELSVSRRLPLRAVVNAGWAGTLHRQRPAHVLSLDRVGSVQAHFFTTIARRVRWLVSSAHATSTGSMTRVGSHHQYLE